MNFTPADIARLQAILPNRKANAIHASDIASQLGLPTEIKRDGSIKFAEIKEIKRDGSIKFEFRLSYWNAPR